MELQQFEALGRVVLKWLDYQIDCGRECLLGEHYLAQPIGEFLLTHYSGTLQTEFSHPVFTKAKRGRPRQIDYGLFTRDSKVLEFGVEAKWVGRSVPAKQSLVDDIMRLEALRPVTLDGDNKSGTTNRYFLLAGTVQEVGHILEVGLNKTGLSPRPRFLVEFLPLSRKRTTVNLKGIHQAWREYFKAFSEDYSVSLPSKYQVRLALDETGTHVRVLVWKISSVGKRTEFDPASDADWKSVTVDETEDPTK